MDHHCRWLANCVSQQNLKFFLNFVFYFSCLNLDYIGEQLTKLGRCLAGASSTSANHCPNDYTAAFLVQFGLQMATIVVSFFIAVFCVCLLCAQLSLIRQNRTYMDNLQRRPSNFDIEMSLHLKVKNNESLIEFQKATFYDRLVEVFGDRNLLWWFVPVYRLEPSSTRVERELLASIT